MEDLIEGGLAECSAEQRTFFAEHRVPFYQVPIHRLGLVESVYAFARLNDKVLYYEDVEEGFAVSRLDENGAIPEQDCNQWQLHQALPFLNG
ncbi:MAG: hypothetical protein JO165_06490 [Candidatus Eremiobacteraeota bacterium]|nr:hypothetical protein [Candidatus Eremiobacteraeota bacterium]